MGKRFVLSIIMLILLAGVKISVSAQDWVLVWSDEFNSPGLPDESKWSYDVGGGGWGNNELQYYTLKREENARIEDSTLIIELRKEAFQERDYTSARLVSKNKGDWLYGRVEVRAKLPSGKGTWPAIWMLPTDWEYGQWPSSGEIDIMEHVGYDQGVIHATVHTADLNHTKGTQVGKSIKVNDCSDQFHVYSIEWYPDRIDAFVDGTKYFTFENRGEGYATWPFDKRFHLLLNIAFGGDWGGAQGIDNSIVSARFYIDYVRVYQKAESGPVSLTVTSTPGGKVIIDPLKTEYLSGDNVVISAAPDSGYEFQSWTGDYHSTSNPFSFVIINSTSLKANFCPKGEMVINGSFDNGLNSWTQWSNTGTSAIREVKDGSFKISISSAGENDWDLQLSQEGMKMVAGNRYRVSYRAWAERERTITVRVNMTVPPHSAWYSKVVSINSTPQTYVYEFTMTNQNDDNARVEFDFGKSTVTTYIDDVSLRNLSATGVRDFKPDYSNGNLRVKKSPAKCLVIEREPLRNGVDLIGRYIKESSFMPGVNPLARGIYVKR
jgi:beta-glucanase (GH16 family)